MPNGKEVCDYHMKLAEDIAGLKGNTENILKKVDGMTAELKSGNKEFTKQAVEIAMLKTKVNTLSWLAYTTIGAIVIEGIGLGFMILRFSIFGGGGA